MKLNKKIIKKIEEEAKRYFEKSSGCHDWSHVERVRENAIKIAKKEGADLAIVETAALLHDIARNAEIRKRGSFCHALEGAKKSVKILEKHNIDLSIIEQVAHAIEAHRSRNSCQPTTIEAKVLQDADRLDSLGAVGVGRIFLFAGNMGSKTLYTGREKKLAKTGKKYCYTEEDSAALEYESKLKYIKDKMLTETGKKIAQERSLFMKEFFKQFWDEIAGKK
jgi:uncharacterized protein